MDDKDKKIEGESCCSTKGCGSGCGGCGSKMIMALVLLLLGGVIGYLMGAHCRMGRGMMGCPMSTTMMMQPSGK